MHGMGMGWLSEIGNRVLLEAMLAREEEVKRRAVIQKEVFAGPQIRFHSKEGETSTAADVREMEVVCAPSPGSPHTPRLRLLHSYFLGQVQKRKRMLTCRTTPLHASYLWL